MLIENTKENAKYKCMRSNNVTILTQKDYKKYVDWFYKNGYKLEDFMKLYNN